MSYKPTVAIVGATGFIGPHLLEAYKSPQFQNKIQLPIVVVTRDASNKQSDSTVKYVPVTAGDENGYAHAFEGVDVVIDLTGLRANHSAIIKAAADSGVKIFIPSEFSFDCSNSPYKAVFAQKVKDVEYARSLGLKTVVVLTNLFLDLVLAYPSLILALDVKQGTFIDTEENLTMSGTFSSDIAKSVAYLTILSELQLPDIVRISGSTFTAAQIAKVYEAVSGKTLEISKTTAKDLTDQANLTFAGGMKGGPPDFFTVVRGSIALGEWNFATNDNELVNPKGGNFKWKDVSKEAEKVFKALEGTGN